LVRQIVHWLLLAVACTTGPVAAEAAEFNVAVAARVVAFRQPPPSGTVTVAIVYDPGDAESQAEAAAIERSVGSGVSAGKAMLRVRKVAVSQLGGLASMSAAFVTSGLRDRQVDIAAAAQRASVLTITSDLACVRAGQCAVAVNGGARVQISVSRAACSAARIQFGSAFLMLVKEF